MYRTWLIPYLEDTLDAEQRRLVETRLAEDPDLAAEMEALRRAEPRLRGVVAHLRQIEGTVAKPAPLWPRLRERLALRPQRPARPVFWWVGSACAAGAAVLAVLMLTPKTHPPERDARLARELRYAPRVVSHRNNAAGTVVAANLQKRAVHVAMAKQAVSPHIAALMAKAKPLPVVLPVARPAAPPLPHTLIAGQPPRSAALPFAPKLPMPVAPPFQMAERELRKDQHSVTYGLPAPTHSPLHNELRAKVATRSLAGGAASDLAFDNPVAPLPNNSPVRVNGNVNSMIGGGGRDVGRSVLVPPMAQNGVGGDGPAVFAPTAGAMTAREAAPQVQAPAGVAALDSLGDAAPLRQRLERTVTPPLYGTPAGAQELQRLLQSARQDGTLDALTSRIEQGPVNANRAAAQEAVDGRLLAAIYELNADLNRALAERRRVALLATADGEDWFELAQTEEHLGNVASAQRAYAQALRTGISLPPAHRVLARQNLP